MERYRETSTERSPDTSMEISPDILNEVCAPLVFGENRLGNSSEAGRHLKCYIRYGDDLNRG